MRVPCAKWLQWHLTMNGACKSADVKAAGRAAGYGAVSISKAASSLGVEIERSRTMPSYSTWRLPATGGQRRPLDDRGRRVVIARLTPHGLDKLGIELVQALARTSGGTDSTDTVLALERFIELFKEHMVTR